MTDSKRGLLRQLTKARDALDEIANPIAYMQREAKREGLILDGRVAVELAENAYYLQEIARTALISTPH